MKPRIREAGAALTILALALPAHAANREGGDALVHAPATLTEPGPASGTTSGATSGSGGRPATAAPAPAPAPGVAPIDPNRPGGASHEIDSE